MEFINRMRKNRKGFTLVEIIVVLVILAILAAFMIPSMLGFVGEAKKKAAIAEQREVYVAAQAIATEQFAKFGKDSAKTDLAWTADTTGTTTDGIAANIGSAVVKDATAAKAAASNAGAIAWEMQNYLTGDIATSGTDAATWTVKIDGTTGKVTEVTYGRNGVTLDPLTPSSAIK